MDAPRVCAVTDGSLDGLLTAVYDYYYGGLKPADIIDGSEESFQQTLDADYLYINADYDKAGKVFAAVEKKVARQARDNIVMAMANVGSGKLFDIFKYIIFAFREPRKIDEFERLDFVMNVHKLVRAVSSETHLLKGFTRFRKTAAGPLYADITPKHNVLPFLCEHFTDRLNNENWIIHDKKRKTAGIYNTEECVLVQIPEGLAPIGDWAPDDENWQSLWTAFYRTIGIQERKNSKLRRQNSPKYFWKNMTEHQRRFFEE